MCGLGINMWIPRCCLRWSTSRCAPKLKFGMCPCEANVRLTVPLGAGSIGETITSAPRRLLRLGGGGGSSAGGIDDHGSHQAANSTSEPAWGNWGRGIPGYHAREVRQGGDHEVISFFFPWKKLAMCRALLGVELCLTLMGTAGLRSFPWQGSPY